MQLYSRAVLQGCIHAPPPISILVPLPVREEDGQTGVEELYKHFGCRLCLVSELLWVYPTTLSIILTQAALSFISDEPWPINRKASFEMGFLQNVPPQIASVTVDSTRIWGYNPA